MAVRAGDARRRKGGNSFTGVGGVRGTARMEPLEGRVLLSTASFAPPVTSSISTTGPASAVAVGDLNRDGIPDLVASSAGAAAVLGGFTAQIFQGASSGTLTPSTIVATGGQVLALGDFNGDGMLDLATAAGVLPGNGKGTFGAVIPGFTMPANTNVVSFFTGDFNGDGKLDLALATFTAASGPGKASIGLDVMLGKGDGTFAASVFTSVGTGANLTQGQAVFATGDFNADGNLDVVSPFGVLLGNGKGGFTAPPQGLPASSTPVNPAFAVGDFNGDGKLDMAMVPPGEAAGKAEIFQGNGDGTFKDAASVVVSTAGATITALDAAEVTGDGFTDLIAGTTQGGNSPTISVLAGNGDNTFAAAQDFSASAVPIEFFTGDFNGDQKPDILSINQAAGTTAGAIAGLNAASADVLLSSTPAATPAAVTLTTSARTALAGGKVILTAIVAGAAGGPAPTGTVTFRSGPNTIGTSPVRAGGRATLVTAQLPLGVQRITAIYSGDSSYGPVTALPLTQTVLVTLSKVPLLVASIGKISFPGTFVAGDRGTVNVTIVNGGAGMANGSVAVDLFASPDGTLDASAVPIAIRSSNRASVHLAGGRNMDFRARIVMGDLPVGKYTILAQITPISRLTATQVSPAPASSPGQYQSAGHVFGTVGGRRNVAYAIAAPGGQTAVLKLSGPGSGAFTQVAGVTDLSISGTRPASRLQIVSRSGPFNFGSISVVGPLADFDGKQAAVSQSLTLDGNVKRLSLASAGTGGAAASITLQGGQRVALVLGTMNNVDLTSFAPITRLSAASWNGGAIAAPWIGSMNVRNTFSADVSLHALRKLQAARLGAISGGNWTVPGGIGSLRVLGSVSSALILAGADAGPDNVLGSPDDSYRPAIIGSITIHGNDTSTTIAAGARPATPGVFSSGLTAIPGGIIRRIAVRGTISPGSYFLAARLPRAA